MADFGKINRSAAFNPTSAFPLDARSYFESYAAALAAAKQAEAVGSTNTVYHYGQQLLVYEGGACTWYIITPDRDLKPVGSGEGSSGADGEDGFSPTVEITEIDGGHRVSITDVNGTESFDVMDGTNGKDGAAGKDGENGVDGKDGVTPEFSIGTVETLAPGTPASASVTGTAEKPILNLGIPRGPTGASGDGSGSGLVITNTAAVGQTVKITAIDAGGKPTEWEAVDMPEGGAAIVDVVELPTENIDEDVFYRVLNGTFYYEGTPQGDWTCYVVESLPQEGVPVTTDQVHVSLYYAVDTASVSGYIPEAMSGTVGVPAGWYPVEALAQAFELGWGGIIWDERDDPLDKKTRLLLSYSLYQFKKDWENLCDRVGWRGTGVAGSEVFNSLTNRATGAASHAEGFGTSAEGDASHAEGYSSHAEGYSSHAEGYSSHAEGDYSHAEGHSTHAGGYYSHAEGSNTTASGYYSHAEGDASHAEGHASHAEGYSSHAEGYGTIAASKNQHVQGKYNIEDTAGKYAHIVGNGDNDARRSNAHTLDWNGVGWYAGGLKVGGTGQDDENAKPVLLEGDVYSKPEIDAIMGSYINDIDALLGGDA